MKNQVQNQNAERITIQAVQRNFGLDVVRALAILLVLIAHSGVRKFFGLDAGFVGVEVFFVLSGFLIGQILFSAKTHYTKKGLLKFYLNRWLRTLPLYFLVVFAKDLLDPSGFHWKFYFFLQGPGDFLFFPVSWSLVIEEWFYLLIPLFLLLNKRLWHFSAGTYLLVLILLVNVVRALVIYKSVTVFEMDIRKTWYLRLDALLIGVLLSHVKINYPFYYVIKNEFLNLLGSGLFFAAGFMLNHFFVVHEAECSDPLLKASSQTLLFIMFSVSIALFIRWMEQSVFINRIRNKIVFWFFTGFSILAYPLYLVHFDFFLKIPFVKGFSPDWLLQTLFYWLGAILLALILHVCIERPVMNKRPFLIRKLLGPN